MQWVTLPRTEEYGDTCELRVEPRRLRDVDSTWVSLSFPDHFSDLYDVMHDLMRKRIPLCVQPNTVDREGFFFFIPDNLWEALIASYCRFCSHLWFPITLHCLRYSVAVHRSWWVRLCYPLSSWEYPGGGYEQKFMPLFFCENCQTNAAEQCYWNAGTHCSWRCFFPVQLPQLMYLTQTFGEITETLIALKMLKYTGSYNKCSALTICTVQTKLPKYTIRLPFLAVGNWNAFLALQVV